VSPLPNVNQLITLYLVDREPKWDGEHKTKAAARKEVRFFGFVKSLLILKRGGSHAAAKDEITV
jgi:hypothetical protein